MNIAYIIPKRINAGPILVVQELVKQMILHGHSCIVFYFDEGQEINFLCSTKKISFSQRIDFNSYDIIHTHGLRPDLYIFLHKPVKQTVLQPYTIMLFLIFLINIINS